MKTHQMSRRDTLRLAGAGLTATALAGIGFGTGVLNAGSAHAAPRIVTRDEWGFNGWAIGKVPDTVPYTDRLDFTVHWQGQAPLLARRRRHRGEPGAAADACRRQGPDHGPRPWDRVQLVISQRGEIFEGRGWDLKAGAVEGHNAKCVSVQVHIREGEVPTWEALDALQINGHSDLNGTECPGPDLLRWTREQGPGLRAEAQRRIDRDNAPRKAEPKKPEEPQGTPPFPGESAFRLGQEHPAVLQLDDALIAKGYTRHHGGAAYQPGPMFSEATRLNVRDFQLDQGWFGSGADGYPGPQTWERLMS